MSTQKLDENSNLQIDEIQALEAIFGDLWQLEDENSKVYSIKITESEREVQLWVTFTSGYPLMEPPIYEISAPWLKRQQKINLSSILEQCYLDHVAENVVFLWIDKIKEFVHNLVVNDQSSTTPNEEEMDAIELPPTEPVAELNLEHGETITDRRSTFQAHLARVKSVSEAKSAIGQLLTNRKISSATHNISAYRIGHSAGNIIQDCDDDGETHAGSRLLHLMEILNVFDVVVVVSRWYGGVQLGPDRFKHINNAARDLLQSNGYLGDKKK